MSIPELEATSRLVGENRNLFALSRCSLHGRSLNDLRAATRREAIAAARSYTASLIHADIPEFASNSCVVSGHQPELFHVGVWAKNFAISGVARRCQSVAINLVIDNDALNSTSLRIPAGTREHLSIDRVPFDTPRPTLPWEEAAVLDRDMYQRFGAVVRDRLRESWGIDPIVGTAWSVAVRQLAVSERLSDGLTAMRTSMERAWGLHNLELPMSRLCETEPFLWFFAHLIVRLPEFHEIYNDAVAEYRRDHRLRNRMQPVPDLESLDGWLEAPFWIWRRGDSLRGRLFARRVGLVVELRDQKEVFARLPATDDSPLDAAVGLLGELPTRGLRLRTRALTTTLFARVCLADLFVHGIGGAKYDAMTDRLCERLFGMVAPSFLTVSATLYLPLGGAFAATEAQLCEINHRLRDLTYNPDRHLKDLPGVAALVAEKNELLASARALRELNQLRGRLTHEQHRRVTEIRAALQLRTEAVRTEYESSRATLRSQLSSNALVRNREYAFGLYPEEQLRQFLTPLSTGE